MLIPRLSLSSACLLALLTLASVRAGQQPFLANAVSSDLGPNLTVSAGGSNLVDFFSSLVKTQGAFQPLTGRPYNAVVNFLGVPNAIVATNNASGTNVTLNFSLINVSKTFAGPTADATNNLVEDFFKKDGLQTLADFLKALAKVSPIAVTDGNPTSATANAADEAFFGQAFTPADDLVDAAGGTAATPSKPRYGGFGIGFNSGHFKAAGFEGDTYDLSFTGFNFGNDRVRVVTPFYLNYLKVGGAQVVGAGVNLAVPIRILVMDTASPINWRVTPLAGVGGRGSADLGSGAALWQAGLINTIDYKVNPKLVVCLMNQFTAHKSISITYGDYTFDPKVDQQILKNGIRAVSPISRRFIGDLFIINTQFLKSAATKQFTTFGGSVAWRATESFNLSLAVNYDTGGSFKAWGVGLTSAWRW